MYKDTQIGDLIELKSPSAIGGILYNIGSRWVITGYDASINGLMIKKLDVIPDGTSWFIFYKDYIDVFTNVSLNQRTTYITIPSGFSINMPHALGPGEILISGKHTKEQLKDFQVLIDSYAYGKNNNECKHLERKTYTGLHEVFMYCVKCDKKFK